MKSRQKAGFLVAISSKITLTKEKEEEKKKRASRKKEGEEKKHGCTLGFYKGYFGVFGRKKKCWIQKVHFSGGNGFKNPARCTVMYVSLIDL